MSTLKYLNWYRKGLKKQKLGWFRKLPIAWDKDIKTAVCEENGPNVMTGYEDGAVNRIPDSFLRSICSWKDKCNH